MKIDKEINRILRQEFKDLVPNTIWESSEGVYEVFGKYQILLENPGYRVYCSDTDIGTFTSTRTALSWCIADKYQNYNLARNLLLVDNKLGALTDDIKMRATLGDRSNNLSFKETVGTKLETKIIHKKQLENQLAKWVSWAKYCQQRGFNNETARTGRNTSNKTSR
jgi:hypothetical protein